MRFSFCCADRDCRKRVTPPSLRFFGRHVYGGAVVVFASAMMSGVTPRRAATLHRLLGVSRRTLMRWRKWWLETFPTTPTWKLLRGALRTPVDETQLPLSLLGAFQGEWAEQLMGLLRALLPLTTSSASAQAG